MTDGLYRVDSVKIIPPGYGSGVPKESPAPVALAPIPLPDRLRALRVGLGRKYTQTVYADAVGVEQGAVSKWETGVRRPDRDSLQLLAKFHGCLVEDIIRGTDSELLTEKSGAAWQKDLPLHPRRNILPASKTASATNVQGGGASGTQIGSKKSSRRAVQAGVGSARFEPPRNQTSFGHRIVRCTDFLEELREMGLALGRGEIAIVSRDLPEGGSLRSRSTGRVSGRHAPKKP